MVVYFKRLKKDKVTATQMINSTAMLRSNILHFPSAQLHQLNNEKSNCLQARKTNSAHFYYLKSSRNTNLHSNDGANVTLSPEQSHYYAGILNSPHRLKSRGTRHQQIKKRKIGKRMMNCLRLQGNHA